MILLNSKLNILTPKVMFQYILKANYFIFINFLSNKFYKI